MHIGRTLPPAASPLGIAEIAAGIRGVLRGRKELDRFRSELKAYFGVKHCFLVSSGKAAFALTLLALKELHPGREEVLIPAFTCYTVPSAVIRAGLRLRLCDLHPESLDFDFGQLSAMLSGGPNDSSRTLLAIVPTHLFGFPSDLPRLRKLNQDPGVTIVEDAAQAMGETWDGRKLGTLGDVGFFSLGRGKALSAVEGGVILTDRDDIARILSRHVSSLSDYAPWQLAGLILKSMALALFTRPSLFWIPRSMPFLGLGLTLFDPHFPILRMSSFQAGLTANWVERLRSLRASRTANVKKWMDVLGEIEGRGSGIHHPRSPALLRLPIRVRDADRRASLLQESGDRGAGIAPGYPDSINRLPELSGKIPAQACAVAESCARELVTLPTHGYLTQDDMALARPLLSRALGAGDRRSAATAFPDQLSIHK
jgi:perosamine synthetase